MNERSMKNTLQETTLLNTRLREKLEKTGSLKGRLKAEFTSTLLLSLSCIRTRDNKSMLVWDFDYPLQKAIRDYMEICAPDTAVLEVDIDLTTDTFHYSYLTIAQQQQRKQEAAMEAEQEELLRRQALKEQLAADTIPVGIALATKVADALLHGRIGHSHRDFCGMGLEYENGRYNYGAVWDGGMDKPEQSFSDRHAFIDWLSKQSNASLANIQTEEAFYWGNQVITRKRLEQFLIDGHA
ncbi:hypothetical protein L3C95_03745 [Chitinophaga filiformis]|uniref:hypothetical protein n=1 Tax=Chitinophaga filiformis TaxID=104663 RepID=UPI001F22A7B1|nr:hypothetical protein [Chitinophaga filiformis]MCF6401970.1 hypothetical protein [Chitinophaga filiformis]